MARPPSSLVALATFWISLELLQKICFLSGQILTPPSSLVAERLKNNFFAAFLTNSLPEYTRTRRERSCSGSSGCQSAWTCAVPCPSCVGTWSLAQI